MSFSLPPFFLLDPMLHQWLQEDIGRGDRSTQGILSGGNQAKSAVWVAKEAGVIAGLPIAARVFQILDPSVAWQALVAEGEAVDKGMPIVTIKSDFATLLMGERVALNLVMRLSGIASATRQYVEKIADLPTFFVDTRKTTPGLRILEKYASLVGGARNHRLGLDDAVMLKDNHIAAVGSVARAIELTRASMPYPLTIEVETENLAQVEAAMAHGADIIMLDNMPLELMEQAVQMIRSSPAPIKIEASGNVSLETIRSIALTGVDYISSSGPMTRSSWLDLSMRIQA